MEITCNTTDRKDLKDTATNNYISKNCMTFRRNRIHRNISASRLRQKIEYLNKSIASNDIESIIKTPNKQKYMTL